MVGILACEEREYASCLKPVARCVTCARLAALACHGRSARHCVCRQATPRLLASRTTLLTGRSSGLKAFSNPSLGSRFRCVAPKPDCSGKSLIISKSAVARIYLMVSTVGLTTAVTDDRLTRRAFPYSKIGLCLRTEGVIFSYPMRFSLARLA